MEGFAVPAVGSDSLTTVAFAVAAVARATLRLRREQGCTIRERDVEQTRVRCAR